MSCMIVHVHTCTCTYTSEVDQCQLCPAHLQEGVDNEAWPATYNSMHVHVLSRRDCTDYIFLSC